MNLEIRNRLSGEFPYMHLFASSQKGLDKAFPRLARYLANSGKLWVSWPKSKITETDLNIKEVIRIGYDHGLVESKVVSLDEDWSAITFTHPVPGKVDQNSFGKLISD